MKLASKSCLSLTLTMAASGACLAEPVNFNKDIQPLLNKHCAQCHGGVKQRGDLNLTSRTLAMDGGESGEPLVVSGSPQKSELFLRLTHADADLRMPPEKPLKDGDIALIERWIEQGAPWPEHWAYLPIGEASPPNVDQQDWPVNEIDYFILHQIEKEGLSPSPPAAPGTLLRRLSLDLTGLPPTVEQLRSFEKGWQTDPEKTLATTADILLASPHFGERWGRHWLDQARYADSDGYEKDNPRPNAWLWRDWVIRAINDDMPFDQFTVEQMAGDLLDDADPSQRLATAFHRQTLRNTEGGTDPEEDRVKRVIDRVATTTRTWLGLTLECAQCHDHPYDPFTQVDFYRLYAFFNDTDEGEVTVTLDSGKKMKAAVMQKNGKRRTYLFHRGDFLQPAKEKGVIQPGGISSLHTLEPPTANPSRMDLAKWLTSRDNPLTARVTSNTVWLHLFGKGLVRSPENFGSQGENPSHPELLSWLAQFFIKGGWSRKQLIRKIVTSRTYRQSSRHRLEYASRDPDNRLLHRQNRKRVEAEIVRDLHLSVAGLLESELGGESRFPPIPADVAAQSFANNFQWKVSKGTNRYRRGMYTFFKRTAPAPNLMTFDCPDSNTSVTQRNVSNTPLMALTTLQNIVFHEASQALARRIRENPALRSNEDRVKHLFQLTLSRLPMDEELRVVLNLLADNQSHYRDHPDQARELGCDNDASLAAWTATVRIITNLDEFITCQ